MFTLVIPADFPSCEHPCAGLPVRCGWRRTDTSPRGHPARPALLPQRKAGNRGWSTGNTSIYQPSWLLLLLSLSLISLLYLFLRIILWDILFPEYLLPSTSGTVQLSNSDPLSGGWSGPAHHHRGPVGGHTRRRPRPQTGCHHHPQCLLCSHPSGLQCPYTHPAVRPHPSPQWLQHRGPVSELGHHQLHHQGVLMWQNVHVYKMWCKDTIAQLIFFIQKANVDSVFAFLV